VLCFHLDRNLQFRRWALGEASRGGASYTSLYPDDVILGGTWRGLINECGIRGGSLLWLVCVWDAALFRNFNILVILIFDSK